MDTSIELRYAGVVIGRATAVGEIAGDSLFLSIADPLPVGTKVSLTIDDRVVEGRVVGVSESSDLTKCGMKVRVGTASAPEPKAMLAPAHAAAPSPVVAAAPVPVPAPAPTAVAEVSAEADSSSPAPSAPPAVEARAPVDEIGSEPSGAHVDGATDGGVASDDSPGPAGGGGGGGGGGRRRRRKR